MTSVKIKTTLVNAVSFNTSQDVTILGHENGRLAVNILHSVLPTNKFGFSYIISKDYTGLIKAISCYQKRYYYSVK